MKAEHAREHLALVLSFFPRVESQINVLVTLEVVMVGYLVSRLPKPDAWADLTLPALLLLAITGAAFLASLLMLYFASFPNLKGGENSMIYFRAIAGRSELSFSESYAHLEADDLLPDLSEQIWRNAQILTLKYARLKHGFICFGGAAVAWAATLVLLPT
jgi:hypothetical protein